MWMPGEASAWPSGWRPVRAVECAVPAGRLAPRLLGCLLVRQLPTGERLAGLIVETEAYSGVRDRACHSFGGRRTARVEVMYGPAGRAYVYFTYGMHHCVNVVCAGEGDPQAVLIRAAAAVDGVGVMRQLRGLPARRGDRELLRGPGALCKGLGIDLLLNGVRLVGAGVPSAGSGAERAGEIGSGSEGAPLSPLSLWAPAAWPLRTKEWRVVSGPRVGIGEKGRWTTARLRFAVAGHPAVSGPREGLT